MKHIIPTLILSVLCTTAARAQPPGDPAQHLEQLATMIGMTDQQKVQARKIHEEFAPRARPLHEQLKKQHDEIEAILDSGHADPADVGRRVIAAWQTHKQLRALHEQVLGKIRTLLTPEQRTKLDKLVKDHEDMHGGMDHFGP
ncbi:MAG TPA: Spy/CpxP family protein refolding chaperone [Kofleriaceae bacterium]|nr:Spy/CpxP family protein refolding chaperone [Kofleriaceae bacterium]